MQRIISALASAAETGSIRSPVPITVARAASSHFAKNFQRDLHVVLLVASEGATDGIQQETLGLVDRVLREVLDTAGSAAQRDMLAVTVSFGAAIDFSAQT